MMTMMTMTITTMMVMTMTITTMMTIAAVKTETRASAMG
jgi:hypothetical protein